MMLSKSIHSTYYSVKLSSRPSDPYQLIPSIFFPRLLYLGSTWQEALIFTYFGMWRVFSRLIEHGGNEIFCVHKVVTASAKDVAVCDRHLQSSN